VRPDWPIRPASDGASSCVQIFALSSSLAAAWGASTVCAARRASPLNLLVLLLELDVEGAQPAASATVARAATRAAGNVRGGRDVMRRRRLPTIRVDGRPSPDRVRPP